MRQAATEQAVGFGHRRWDIENYGFNELVNEWHSDHVYKHHPKAIEAFLLVAFLAYNLFHAFWLLNLKPAARHGGTQRYWARLMARELCQDTCFAEGSSPKRPLLPYRNSALRFRPKFLRRAATCAISPLCQPHRVYFPPCPADKADANLPNRLQRARTNYFAPLQPRMRNRCLYSRSLSR